MSKGLLIVPKDMRPLIEFEEVQRLIAAGLNDCQIGRRTGIPRRTVLDWRHGRYGNVRTRVDVDCPDCHVARVPSRPYAYLLGMYLGDGCISRSRKGVYRLRIVMDLRYPGIIVECATAITAVRPSKPMRAGRIPKISCTEVYADRKHWPIGPKA